MPLLLEPGRFFGQSLPRHECRAGAVTESSYATATRLPRHGHARDHFCFVLAGGFRERLGRLELARRPMSLTFQPAAIEHEEEHGLPGRHLLIEFDRRTLLPDRGDQRRLDAPHDLTATPAVAIARRLQHALHDGGPPAPLDLDELLLALVDAALHVAGARPATGAPAAPAWLRAVDEQLRGDLTVTPTLDQLALAAGVHRCHLARAYRRSRGRTIGDQLRRLRTAHACERLAAGEPLLQVALGAGFADQAHFCRVFRRLLGTTPGAFARGGR